MDGNADERFIATPRMGPFPDPLCEPVLTRTTADESFPRAGVIRSHGIQWAGSDFVVAAAPAKVNLFLELFGKRPDGYHALETLMLAVDLYDTLELRLDSTGTITLECEPDGVPVGSENIVWKAAEALRAATNNEKGVAIRLTKRIPHQAGLGGGSSDAAATLIGLNRLWGLNLDRPRLLEIAATLGSDVGFFLAPPAAWCTGRGEQVEPTGIGNELHLVLVKPTVGLSTAVVYRSAVSPSRPVSGEPIRHALQIGDPTEIAQYLHNRLEAPAFAAAPEVATVAERLRILNPLGVLLSGSGSSVFALCRDRTDAIRTTRQFLSDEPAEGPACRVFAVRSVRWP